MHSFLISSAFQNTHEITGAPNAFLNRKGLLKVEACSGFPNHDRGMAVSPVTFLLGTAKSNFEVTELGTVSSDLDLHVFSISSLYPICQFWSLTLRNIEYQTSKKP